MGQLRNLIPVLTGRNKTSQGITVSGNQIRFSNEIVQKLGATDHVVFQIGGDDDNHLYIRTNVPGASEFKLKGKEGGRRYVNDAGVVTVAKLGSDTYPLLYDEELKAHYIVFDPNAPAPTPKPKAVRKPAAAPKEGAPATTSPRSGGTGAKRP